MHAKTARAKMVGASYERIGVFVFGVVFLSLMLILAIFFPSPTPFQYTVFRITLALAAAGVGALVPGMLNARVGGVVKAGGAMAVFVVVFFFSPARLLID